MGTSLAKDAIDLGIVVRDGEAALRFYRDTLGLEFLATTPMPGLTMHRLMCGNSMIKIVIPDRLPEAAAPPGGFQAATGIRYWTVSVSNLDQVVADCASGGYRIAVPPREIRPGVRIAMVEDPEGNWLELVQAS